MLTSKVSRRRALCVLPLAALAACSTRVLVTTTPGQPPIEVKFAPTRLPPTPTTPPPNTPEPAAATRVPVATATRVPGPTAPPALTPTPRFTPLPTQTANDALQFGYRLGVNCVDDFDSRTGANFAASHGAPVVVLYGDKPAAVELKQRYPNCVAVFRPRTDGVGTNPDALLQRLELAGSDPPLFYLGHNENEMGVGLAPEGIRARAAFDVAVARKLRELQPKATYVAGSFAHGEPDFTNPAVSAAIREGYAEAYNKRVLWLDMHNYTRGKLQGDHPPANAEMIAPKWFERRWEFLFTACGFDPAVRAICATETGVEAGKGGFSWAGYSETQFVDWLFEHRRIQLAPLMVNGRAYPSPFRFGALFQFGVSGQWRSYDLRGYLSALADEWRR